MSTTPVDLGAVELFAEGTPRQATDTWVVVHPGTDDAIVARRHGPELIVTPINADGTQSSEQRLPSLPTNSAGGWTVAALGGSSNYTLLYSELLPPGTPFGGYGALRRDFAHSGWVSNATTLGTGTGTITSTRATPIGGSDLLILRSIRVVSQLGASLERFSADGSSLGQYTGPNTFDPYPHFSVVASTPDGEALVAGGSTGTGLGPFLWTSDTPDDENFHLDRRIVAGPAGSSLAGVAVADSERSTFWATTTAGGTNAELWWSDWETDERVGLGSLETEGFPTTILTVDLDRAASQFVVVWWIADANEGRIARFDLDGTALDEARFVIDPALGLGQPFDAGVLPSGDVLLLGQYGTLPVRYVDPNNVTTPGAVEGLTAENLVDHSPTVEVSWSIPGDRGGAVIDEYRLDVSDGRAPLVVHASTNVVRINDLLPSRTYTVTISALNYAGTGSPSQVEFTTRPPSRQLNVSHIATDTGQGAGGKAFGGLLADGTVAVASHYPGQGYPPPGHMYWRLDENGQRVGLEPNSAVEVALAGPANGANHHLEDAVADGMDLWILLSSEIDGVHGRELIRVDANGVVLDRHVTDNAMYLTSRLLQRNDETFVVAGTRAVGGTYPFLDYETRLDFIDNGVTTRGPVVDRRSGPSGVNVNSMVERSDGSLLIAATDWDGSALLRWTPDAGVEVLAEIARETLLTVHASGAILLREGEASLRILTPGDEIVEVAVLDGHRIRDAWATTDGFEVASERDGAIHLWIFDTSGVLQASGVETETGAAQQLATDRRFVLRGVDAGHGSEYAFYRWSGVPTEPVGLSLTDASGAAPALNVTWSHPTDDGGSAVTGYRVTLQPGDRTRVVGPDARSLSFQDLSWGTTYTATAVAVNDIGAGLAATASSATPPQPATTTTVPRTTVPPTTAPPTTAPNTVPPTTAPTTPPPTTAPPTPRPSTDPPTNAGSNATRSGYWMLERDGQVHPFGDVAHHGDVTSGNAVKITGTSDGDGYWVLDSDGRVHAFGSASHHGDLITRGLVLEPGEHPSTLSALPDDSGYWVFTNRGRAVEFGAAEHYGDVAHLNLNGPVIDSIATPTGRGYWQLGSDGGIFANGDAEFHGSIQQYLHDVGIAMAANEWLNEPIVAIVASPGSGYWLVGEDGGTFSFGGAPYRGSVPAVLRGHALNRPVNGMVAYGNGYLMVATDGGVFTFSELEFLGSLGAAPPDTDIVSLAAIALP